MSKIEYEIRKDGNPYMRVAEFESEPLETIMILEDYPYIQNAMDEENYELKNLSCFVFNEIIFENKVVGFATYDVRNNFEMIMTECYILPEFRGNRLFFDEICKMHFAAPKFGILQPTRNVIQLLLDYAFAKNITDEIVVSAIDLYLDYIDIKSNKRDGLLLLEVPSSNFYDLSISSTLFVHEDEVFYHGLLENDKMQGNNRKKLNKSYFDNILNFFSKNHDELVDLIVELKDELPQVSLGYDEVVGHGDGLSEYMQGIVDEGMISFNDAMEIKKQLINEYESGKIDDKSIDDRLTVLMLENATECNGDFAEFNEILNSQDIHGSELGELKAIIDLIGDDEESINRFLNALIEENEFEIAEMMMNKLENEGVSVEFLDSLDDDLEDEESVREFVIENLENKYRLGDAEYDKENSDYIWETFVVLEALEYGDNYYDALNGIYLESLVSPELLTSQLSDLDFIKHEGIIEVDWFKKAPNCPNPYLKKILRDNNLETDGDKKDLIKRLADNNVTLGDAYKITKKGKDYLKEHYWIAFFEEYFDEFDFNDFHKYFDSHKGNIKDISLKYLEEHIKLASKNNDEFYLDECEYVKNDIHESADEFLSDLDIPE